jgi:hypothetical protein
MFTIDVVIGVASKLDSSSLRGMNYCHLAAGSPTETVRSVTPVSPTRLPKRARG